MRIEGPEIYKLALTPIAFTVLYAKSTSSPSPARHLKRTAVAR
jgi:hypothetical protein